MSSHVYKITNKITDKFYIGKANDVEKRWKSHLRTAQKGKGTHGFSRIHDSMVKHKHENFDIEVIEVCENSKIALSQEKIWIKKLNAKDRNIGYNLTDGGDGRVGCPQSSETRAKISAALKGKYVGIKNWGYGKKLSPEHCQKISAGNMGKTLTQEAKDKISIANSGENNGMYGHISTPKERAAQGIKISEAKKKSPKPNKPFTDETIEKLKLAVKEKSSQKLSDEQKDQIIIMYDTGNYLKRELAVQFNVEEKTIRYIIRYWNEVKLNKNKYLTNDQKNKIIVLFDLGANTKREISVMLGIKFERVVSWIKFHKKKIRENK